MSINLKRLDVEGTQIDDTFDCKEYILHSLLFVHYIRNQLFIQSITQNTY